MSGTATDGNGQGGGRGVIDGCGVDRRSGTGGSCFGSMEETYLAETAANIPSSVLAQLTDTPSPPSRHAFILAPGSYRSGLATHIRPVPSVHP